MRERGYMAAGITFSARSARMSLCTKKTPDYSLYKIRQKSNNMKKLMQWGMAVTLTLCGTAMFSSCSKDDDETTFSGVHIETEPTALEVSFSCLQTN